jgi:hypothetical protein
MRFKASLRSSLLCVFALTFTVFCGCGRQSGTVSGKVTYQGKELKGGTVAFISSEGLPSGTTQIKEDGTYEVRDISAGKYQIAVDTEALIKTSNSDQYGSKMTRPAKEMGPPPGANVPEGYKASSGIDADAIRKSNAKKYVKIPLNYGKPDTSGLEFTVVAGSQNHDIELK